jgi:hypothetical protein
MKDALVKNTMMADGLPGCTACECIEAAIVMAIENGCNVTFAHNGKSYCVEREQLIDWVANSMKEEVVAG